MKKKIINKLSFKLIFDAIMMILLALMYNKTAISMRFHEIGGLVLSGLFILHIVFNYKWVAGVTKKLLSKSLPVKTRIGYIVNLLLLLSFALVCISGIFISKELFRFNSGMLWKTVHYTSAAIALILTGVHIGLHLKTISSFIKNKTRLPASAGKAIGAICLTVLVVFGIYSVNTTSFTKWLSMPFTMSAMPSVGEMPARGEEFGGREGLESPADGRGQGQGQRPMDGRGQGQGQRSADGRDQYGAIHGNVMQGGFSISNALLVIAQFTSIMLAFAVLIFILEMFFKRKRKIG